MILARLQGSYAMGLSSEGPAASAKRDCSRPPRRNQNDWKLLWHESGALSAVRMRVGPTHSLLAACFKAKILVKEWHHMVLKAVCHCARVGAVINLKAIRDSILIENIVELARINA